MSIARLQANWWRRQRFRICSVVNASGREGCIVQQNALPAHALQDTEMPLRVVECCCHDLCLPLPCMFPSCDTTPSSHDRQPMLLPAQSLATTLTKLPEARLLACMQVVQTLLPVRGAKVGKKHPEVSTSFSRTEGNGNRGAARDPLLGAVSHLCQDLACEPARATGLVDPAAVRQKLRLGKLRESPGNAYTSKDRRPRRRTPSPPRLYPTASD